MACAGESVLPPTNPVPHDTTWDFYRTEKELQKSRRRAEEWIVPTLRRFFSVTNGMKILDVGCGNAVEVAVLRESGYTCAGVDLDPSCFPDAKGSFVQANACALPFPTDFFDATVSLEVIEHIGAPPGWWRPLPDSQAKRALYSGELVRVTRPGGIIILATPNRLFPFDEHGNGRTQLRWHLPIRDLTLSYFELRRLFAAATDRIEVLPYGRYYALEKIERLVGETLTRLLSLPLPVLSHWLLHWSPLNPHLFLYFRKRSSVQLTDTIH